MAKVNIVIGGRGSDPIGILNEKINITFRKVQAFVNIRTEGESARKLSAVRKTTKKKQVRKTSQLLISSPFWTEQETSKPHQISQSNNSIEFMVWQCEWHPRQCRHGCEGCGWVIHFDMTRKQTCAEWETNDDWAMGNYKFSVNADVCLTDSKWWTGLWEPVAGPGRD